MARMRRYRKSWLPVVFLLFVAAGIAASFRPGIGTEPVMVHGLCVTLEIDRTRAVREIAEEYVDFVRTQLRKAQIRYKGLNASGSGVEVEILSGYDLDSVARLFEEMNVPVPGNRGDSLVVTREGRHFRLTPTQPVINDCVNTETIRTKEAMTRRWEYARMGTIFSARIDAPGRLALRIEGAESFEKAWPGKDIIESLAKLTIHLVPLPFEPVGPETQVPPGHERVMDLVDRNKSYLVPRRIVGASGDLANVSKVRTVDGTLGLRFQLNAMAAHRLKKIMTEHVGGAFAFVMEGKLLGFSEIERDISSGVFYWRLDASENEVDELLRMVRSVSYCYFAQFDVVEQHHCSWAASD